MVTCMSWRRSEWSRNRVVVQRPSVSGIAMFFTSASFTTKGGGGPMSSTGSYALRIQWKTTRSPVWLRWVHFTFGGI